MKKRTDIEHPANEEIIKQHNNKVGMPDNAQRQFELQNRKKMNDIMEESGYQRYGKSKK